MKYRSLGGKLIQHPFLFRYLVYGITEERYEGETMNITGIDRPVLLSYFAADLFLG